MQNDSLLPFLYYSFLCNFTSIYVFFLSICKKYIKYALHFLLKLLLTIHLWRMLPDFLTEKCPRVLLHPFALTEPRLRNIGHDSKKSLLRKLFLSFPIKIRIRSL